MFHPSYEWSRYGGCALSPRLEALSPMTGLTYLPEIHAASVLTPPWSVSSAANRASPVHENESIGALDPLRGVGALPVVHLKDISSVSSRSSSSASPTKRRKSFTAEFKLGVVREALKRPDKNRIKPICRLYPQVTPVRMPIDGTDTSHRAHTPACRRRHHLVSDAMPASDVPPFKIRSVHIPAFPPTLSRHPPVPFLPPPVPPPFLTPPPPPPPGATAQVD